MHMQIHIMYVPVQVAVGKHTSHLFAYSNLLLLLVPGIGETWDRGEVDASDTLVWQARAFFCKLVCAKHISFCTRFFSRIVPGFPGFSSQTPRDPGYWGNLGS